MNRTIRTLIIAGPLAAAALTLTPGVASAETPAPHPGPVIVMPAEPGDPAPKDIAIPEPQPEPGPQVPDDKAPVPPKDTEPDPAPEVPDHNDDITDVPNCTHGCGDDETPDFPLDSGCFEDCDLPEEPQDETPKGTQGAPEAPQNQDTGIVTPTRVDAGLGSPLAENDGSGLDLSFVLIGGALVTATGAAYAARARNRRTA
ncbi:MAG: hypothetical protein NTV23_02070 [Propionibacteriales bacterium]|nr:hypothetical protein [Propionibacteriales bacterium]